MTGELPTMLSDRDAWTGGFYELAMQLGGDPRVGGFPFEPDDADSLAWRRPIDDWFARLAEEVRRDAGFRLAVIGFEVSGGIRAEKLGSRDEEHPYGLVLPDGTYLPAVS